MGIARDCDYDFGIAGGGYGESGLGEYCAGGDGDDYAYGGGDSGSSSGMVTITGTSGARA